MGANIMTRYLGTRAGGSWQGGPGSCVVGCMAARLGRHAQLAAGGAWLGCLAPAETVLLRLLRPLRAGEEQERTPISAAVAMCNRELPPMRVRARHAAVLCPCC